MELTDLKTYDFDSPEGPGPTEADFVAATLAFLNGDQIRAGEIHKWSESDISRMETSLRTVAKFATLFREAGLLKESRDERPAPAHDYQARYRMASRDLFAAYVRDHVATSDILRGEGFTIGLPNITLLRAVDKGLAIVHHYSATTFERIVNVGTALLLDRERGFGRVLCQCRLESCGKFFFEKKPAIGRPSRSYCSKKHMVRAHEENAPARMARIRSKRARKKR